MKPTMHYWAGTFGIVLGTIFSLTAPATAQEFSFQTVTFVGNSGDSVQGMAIQSDGSLVVAANVSNGPFAPEKNKETQPGLVIRLSSDGKKILSVLPVAEKVRDLAIDAQDNIYVAADKSGAIKVNPDAGKIIWQRELENGLCCRIDAGGDGNCVALQYSRDDLTSTGLGMLYVFDKAGKEIAHFPGHRNTLDVTIDAKSQTVIHIGWRQANAFDGKRKFPVQIAYVQGRDYQGKVKYTLYDWSTDREAPNFLNRPTNNMADTRGYRCSLGHDGLLYCAFECAGGNHIFRYEPQLVKGDWVSAGKKRPKIDKYHEFYNSRAEHKPFFGVYEPATGKLLRGQQYAARLSTGRANAVRVRSGAIAASGKGVLVAGGTSPSGLPLSFIPPGTGDYTGGSWLLVLQPDLSERLFSTRMQPGGKPHAIAAREVNGKLIVAFGGTTNSQSNEEFWTHNDLQPNGEPACGFLAVMIKE